MGKNAHIELPWGEMPFLLALANEKTLSGAARRLDIDRTTVARRIEVLEFKLGEKLFERANGSFLLTEFGRKIFAAAERAEQELEPLGAQRDAKEHSKGKVRLTMPEQFALTLTDRLLEFKEQHPDILLEVSSTDAYSLLKHYEADIALRFSPRAPSELDATRLGQMSYGLYRSVDDKQVPDQYLTFPGQNAIPKEISKILPNITTAMSVNGFIPMREFIAIGAGAGVLPLDLGEQDQRIMRVKGAADAYSRHLWLLCLPEQKRLYRVQMLWRFLRKVMKDHPGMEQ